MLVASLLLLIGISFYIGCGISYKQLDDLPGKYEIICTFTGEIISRSQGYLYICGNQDFTSLYDAGQSPKIVKMYHVCDHDLVIDNNKDVVCGYKELVIQYVLLLIFGAIFTTLSVMKLCITYLPSARFSEYHFS